MAAMRPARPNEFVGCRRTGRRFQPAWRWRSLEAEVRLELAPCYVGAWRVMAAAWVHRRRTAKTERNRARSQTRDSWSAKHSGSRDVWVTAQGGSILTRVRAQEAAGAGRCAVGRLGSDPAGPVTTNAVIVAEPGLAEGRGVEEFDFGFGFFEEGGGGR
ncbi:uncharacterized protein A4U43_C07F11150 [Asparagus officinalis]|uniref:Uncharacterized protein n=1 Tax=Asparagus officinalis TaxID=4686 RepID=A0A5P1EB14_ASPOF|nr:uncharacterized protein A4U43_C07F11150 [Asparagus officinalis]